MACTYARQKHQARNGCMPLADLDFKPSVEVFDANISLGRRHDRRVTVDTVEATLAEMDRAGVQRALAYAPHAATFDSQDGNRRLLEMVAGESRLYPQLVCNPAFDDLDAFAQGVRKNEVRSLRMLPALHRYPLRDWVVGRWLEWAAAEAIPIWMPVQYGSPANRPELGVDQFDPSSLYQIVADYPALTLVLSEAQYRHAGWVLKLLERSPNLHIEVSRFVGTDAIMDLMKAAGPKDLAAICSGNIERLLGVA